MRKARLLKIQKDLRARSGSYTFHRLHFMFEDGEYAMTDVVPTFRNYANWEPVIRAGIGTWIGNMTMKGKQKIDADSPIMITQAPLIYQTPLNFEIP